MLLEAQSAAAYWQSFEGIPLKWEKANHIPANWLTIGNRTSPKTGSPRKAIDPFNAALNYLYAVLETKVRFTCLVNNVDPDFGILHVDHATRGSLVFDLMEPHRSKVDRLLLEWVLSRTFNKKDFFETREGVCRVSQEIISQIIPIIDGLSSGITNTVKEFTRYFKDKAYRQKPKHFQEVVKEKPALRLKPEVPKESKQLDKVCCLECGKEFIPEKPGQIFCSKTHKDTYRKRKLREKRKVEGKCPQCGKPMSEGAKGTYKEKLSYCEKCKGYWERRYKIRSNGG